MPGETLIERLRTLKKRAAKQSLTVRYDADIVECYRSKGKGQQQAMNDALCVHGSGKGNAATVIIFCQHLHTLLLKNENIEMVVTRAGTFWGSTLQARTVSST